MKRMLLLSIATLLLTACGGTGTGGGGGTQGGGSGTGGGGGNGTGGGGQGGGQTQLSSRISLPNKVKYVSTMTSLTTRYESYKIGNEFMMVDRDNVVYGKFNESTGKIAMYFSYFEGDKITWLSDAEETTLFSLYEQANQGFLVEYDDTNSYFSKYVAKKREDTTKDIVGHTCNRYYDSTSNFEFWVEDSTMLIYEETISGYIYQIEEISTDFAGFPYQTPSF